MTTGFAKRRGVRFGALGNQQARVRVDGDTAIQAQILDIGLGGCRLKASEIDLIKVGSEVEVEFNSTLGGPNNPSSANQRSKVAHLNAADRVFGAAFLSPMAPWTLQRVSPSLTAIPGDMQNNNQQFDCQRYLALSDIGSLQAAVRGLRDKQFQMLITGLPLFSGLLGTAFAFIPSVSNPGPVAWWVMLLPFFAVVLSFCFLAIFMQKNSSIRRQHAFTHVLQTHLSFGCFPPCYRGWVDAYANYNHYIRYGGGERYDIPRVPSYLKLTRMAPADAFSLISVALLIATPPVSLVLMYVLLLRSEVALMEYTSIVAVTAAGVAIGIVLFCLELNGIRKGDRSYRSMLLIFDKILHFAPPFDPTNDRPLE